MVLETYQCEFYDCDFKGDFEHGCEPEICPTCKRHRWSEFHMSDALEKILFGDKP